MMGEYYTFASPLKFQSGFLLWQVTAFIHTRPAVREMFFFFLSRAMIRTTLERFVESER